MAGTGRGSPLTRSRRTSWRRGAAALAPAAQVERHGMAVARTGAGGGLRPEEVAAAADAGERVGLLLPRILRSL